MSQRILFLVITSIALVAIVFSVLLFNSSIKTHLKDNIITNYSTQELAVTQAITQSIRSQISSQLLYLDDIAALGTNQTTTSVCSLISKDSATIATQFTAVELLNNQGKTICSSPFKLSEQNSFTTPLTISQSFETVPSKINKSEYLLYLNVPVTSPAATTSALLRGTVNLNKLFEGYENNYTFNPQTLFAVFKPNGDIIYSNRNEFIGKNFRTPFFEKVAHPNQAFISLISLGMRGLNSTGTYSFQENEWVGSVASIEVVPNTKWVVLLSLPTAAIAQSSQSARIDDMLIRFIIGVTSASILIFSLLFFLLTHNVFEPILELTKVTEKITNGDFTARVKYVGKNEVGRLARLFNEMAEKLEWSFKNLENRANQKTQEVETKVTELEKLNKFMVGRELEMVELKKEINDLKRATDRDFSKQPQ